MHQPIKPVFLTSLPSGEPPRAIEGYVQRYLERDDLRRSMRLSLAVFQDTKHAPDAVINVAGDLARAHLAPVRGTLLLVYTEGGAIVYEHPPVSEEPPLLAA